MKMKHPLPRQQPRLHHVAVISIGSLHFLKGVFFGKKAACR